jgi:hypothetical protein
MAYHKAVKKKPGTIDQDSYTVTNPVKRRYIMLHHTAILFIISSLCDT